MDLIIIVVYVLFVLTLLAAVASLARDRNRSVGGYVLAALIISPFVIMFLLLILGNNKAEA